MGYAEELFERLINQGSHGIKQLFADEISEDLFLEYKTSRDNGSSTKIHDDDVKNLGKSISGFGNSEGGIIVWGVSCRKNMDGEDIPLYEAEKLIINPNRFRDWLINRSNSLTIPLHNTVRHHAIEEVNNTGYVITLIPSGNHAPYQTVRDSRYLIRTGSSFMPAPHGVLAGMFGRRPQPKISVVPVTSVVGFQNMTMQGISGIWLHVEIYIYVRNEGLGLAEDVFLSVEKMALSSKKISVTCDTESEAFSKRMAFSLMGGFILRPRIKIPPDAEMLPAKLTFLLNHPIEENIEITLKYGATGSETRISKIEFISTPETLDLIEKIKSSRAHEVIALKTELAQKLIHGATAALES